ncbi:MAG: 16S rRNA (cytidine(1402)-2'-O)-methyltransferase [uncultured Sphingomonas sp.]|uniref:Ribosomal RNA small subunit methyltransferase I n=1 Tax=uncultured Sphingomonas sp. TaxID=158754 RepID=A0A6J4SJN5_9SPHN|nr:16S rRNA (cytidine(1402)-2'-O)-methyltransferase [uncultured Sphingomonas sp.]CAA9497796.1 MAG: 16S rRNA (cytidine(1402)-2'-O)-methyltransferase [uncultured Sphingomonas sp.]
MNDEPLPAGLYIVATPIGNLGDLSPRAGETLRRADLVLAEDKRVTAKLLAHAEARAPMRVYHDHSSGEDRKRIVAELADKAVALVSDAGTPLISDPGYKLVRAAREAGHAVHTVPGPCAAVAALTLAGLPTDRFLFMGFLPAKAKARAEAIAEVATVRASLVLYESGPRLAETLEVLADGLGPRDAAVAREISKLYEECVTGILPDLAGRYAEAPPKGEIVIVVGPPPAAAETSDEQLDQALDEALAAMTPSRAAAAVAEQLGLPRKRVYARALERGR